LAALLVGQRREADLRELLKSAYSVEKLCSHAAAKNLGRYGAVGSRSAEGLPPDNVHLTWVRSDWLHGILLTVVALDDQLTKERQHRETGFFNRIGQQRSFRASG
jgi:hypothetical protein